MLRYVSRTVMGIALAALLLALALALDLSPWLRGGYGWRWPYHPAQAARMIPLALATGVYVAGAWLFLRRTTRVVPVLAWSLIGAAFIPLAVIALRFDRISGELFERTVSPMTTGQHRAAAVLDWDTDPLGHWPDVMRDFKGTNSHMSVSAPGLAMVYRALSEALDAAPGLADPLHRAVLPYQCHNYNLLDYTPGEWASAWLGMLMPLWAALAVLPLYAVARRLSGSPAREVAAWWPLVPSLVMFAPSWSTVYPLFALGAFGLLLAGLTHRSAHTLASGAGWFAAAGLLIGLLNFLNFAFLPVIGLLGFYTLAHYILVERRRAPAPGWGRPTMVGAWFALGLIIPWLVFALVTGVTPLDLFRTMSELHLVLDRSYLPWVFLHVWDWSLLTGVPLIALWVGGVWAWARRRDDAPPVLGIALLLTILVLTISGTTRGESGRVWLPFAPFALIAALDGLRHLSRPAENRPGLPWLVVTLTQAALVLVLAIHWDVIGSGLEAPPDPPGGLATVRPANVTFGETLRLASWNAAVGVDPQTGDPAILLSLDWQPSERPIRPYWFSALLVAPDGTPAPEAVVWQPLDTHYPTTCWAAGEWVGDAVALPLPDNAAAGDWWISLSVLDEQDDEYRPVRLAGSEEAQVGLGPVAVP